MRHVWMVIWTPQSNSLPTGVTTVWRHGIILLLIWVNKTTQIKQEFVCHWHGLTPAVHHDSIRCRVCEWKVLEIIWQLQIDVCMPGPWMLCDAGQWQAAACGCPVTLQRQAAWDKVSCFSPYCYYCETFTFTCDRFMIQRKGNWDRRALKMWLLYWFSTAERSSS